MERCASGGKGPGPCFVFLCSPLTVGCPCATPHATLAALIDGRAQQLVPGLWSRRQIAIGGLFGLFIPIVTFYAVTAQQRVQDRDLGLPNRPYLPDAVPEDFGAKAVKVQPKK